MYIVFEQKLLAFRLLGKKLRRELQHQLIVTLSNKVNALPNRQLNGLIRNQLLGSPQNSLQTQVLTPAVWVRLANWFEFCNFGLGVRPHREWEIYQFAS